MVNVKYAAINFIASVPTINLSITPFKLNQNLNIPIINAVLPLGHANTVTIHTAITMIMSKYLLNVTLKPFFNQEHHQSDKDTHHPIFESRSN